jgi:hypothetical protein
MSANSFALVPSPLPPNFDDRAGLLDDLHYQIILNLARAHASSTARLARAADGHSVFTSDADYARTLALLKSLPTHLDLFGKYFYHLYDLAEAENSDEQDQSDNSVHP